MKLRLKRELGLFEATAYGVGIIIGAGIYALIGPAAGLAGNMLWLSFVIGAVTAVLTGLSYAELSSMFPKAAAEYVYVKRAYRSDYLAFLIGWLLIFTGIVSVSTVSLGFSGYFNSMLGFVNSQLLILVAAAVIAALSFVNFTGIRESSKINILFTSITILGLVLVIALGAGKFGSINYFESASGYGGVFAAAALIFFAYLGFEEIVNISEETRRPKKIIPRALLLAVAITTIFYVLTSVSTVSLADWRELRDSPAPLAYAVSKSFLGTNAQMAISLVALFATAGTVLGLLIVTSRMVYGISNEGSLPKILSRLNRRTKTPYIAITLIGILSIVFLFAGNIKFVAEITSLGALMTFTVVNLALIWLRFTRPDAERPFKVPLNIGKYPVVAFIGIFSTLFMIFQFEFNLVGLTLIVLAIGTAVYILHKKGHIGGIVESTTGIDIEKR